MDDKIAATDGGAPQGGEVTSFEAAFSAAFEESSASQEGQPAYNSAQDNVPAEDSFSDSTEGPSMEPLNPPATWSGEYQRRFLTLPRDIQEVILDRESERERNYTKKHEEVSRERSKYAQLEAVLQPYAERYAVSGRTPADVLQQTLAIEAMFARDPRAGIKWMAERYGIDLSKPLPQGNNQSQTQQPQAAPSDPRVQQLEQELAGLRQSQYNDHLRACQADLEQFKANHPYLEDLRDAMIPIVDSLEKTSSMPNEQILETAYQIALNQNEDVRTKVEIAKDLEKQRAAEAKARQAKLAGSSVTGAPNGSGVVNTPKTLRGIIDAAFEGALR